MNNNLRCAVLAGAATVLFGALLVFASPGTRLQSLAAALLALGGISTIGFLVRASMQGMYRVLIRLERLSVANHKRASIWNSRLDARLDLAGVARPAVEDMPEPVVAEQNNRSSWKNHPQASLLLESRIFDADHYAAVTNSRFDREADAASHFLSLGATKEISPTPLLDLSFLPKVAKKAILGGDARPMLDYLRTDIALERPLSVLFDPVKSGVHKQAAMLHPGGVLGAFLDMDREDPTWKVESPEAARYSGRVMSVRDTLVEHARGVHAAKKLTGPREQSGWDDAAERVWLRQIHSLEDELPLVSVVMPVKNRARVVQEAIASIQAQTHTNWELLVVDDGSSDETWEVISEIADFDERVRLIRGSGGGVSAARNSGLDQASGEYVAFLDSDNQWVEHFLRTSLLAMRRDNLLAAYAAVAVHAKTDADVRYRAFVGGREHLLMLNHIDLNVLVVRKDVLGAGIRFDESLRRWVDHDFAIKVATIFEPKLLPFIGCAYDHSEDSVDRITVRESEHWQWVVLGRHWVSWGAACETVKGRLTVVVPTYNDSAMTIAAVTSVLADADASGLDVEVVVIDNGSRLEFGQAILANLGTDVRVRYNRLPRNLNFAIGCNVGAASASGELVLFLNNDTVVRAGALRELMERMADPAVLGVQPLLVYADETIQTAGTVFPARDSLPCHLLTGHPPADALPLADQAFDAVTAAALVMRSEDIRQLGGFDPIFVNGMEDVDLCLRARQILGGHFALVPSAVVTHLESKSAGRGTNVLENRRIFLQRWRGRLPSPQEHLYRSTGFSVAAVGTDGREVPGPKPVVVRDRRGGSALRWGIKIASIPGARGDMWGDTHFGESLRAALVATGQAAVVHRHGSHTAPCTAHDDVNLVIRGLDRVRPMPGQVNILWVISHPEAVSVEEIREFDLVFAASLSWSRKMTELSGRDVLPLLQATDVARFNETAAPRLLDAVLFVGGIHVGRERPVVNDALAARVPLGVYGPGWAGRLPEGVHLGEYVENHELASYYRGAHRVLADHWEVMADEGFIQNRLFDAVAAGCYVISDEVEGIADVFRGAVQTYTTPSELGELCAPGSDQLFPPPGELARISEEIRRAHSFTRRAEQLVEATASILATWRSVSPEPLPKARVVESSETREHSHRLMLDSAR